jgi:hypothetical protein
LGANIDIDVELRLFTLDQGARCIRVFERKILDVLAKDVHARCSIGAFRLRGCAAVIGVGHRCIIPLRGAVSR